MVVLGMSASTVPMMSPLPQANSELEFVVSGLNNKNTKKYNEKAKKCRPFNVYLNCLFNIC